MQFKHLKITGFKSFAEPEAIAIDEGLTGVVGPNGCGKSNIVESMRWLMGESAARTMRSSELEDVIFSGTEARPSRNFAEVALLLENDGTGRTIALPDGIAETPGGEIEISRKLERGKGTSYRINGKSVRGRDVQLLFADLATGSRSSGIVSQGNIDMLINAKPHNRRILLEEAASISGLHQRRHEAELRLGTAETNLGRLEDILIQMDEQKASLMKQARQAARYRSVADRIRKADAKLLLAKFTATMQSLDEAETLMRETERTSATATQAVSASQRKHDEHAATLPSLRQAEAEAAAQDQRLKLALEALDNEEQQAQQAAQTITARKQQIDSDIIRENTLLSDVETAIATLAKEATALAEQESDEAPKIEAATATLATVREQSSQAEAALAEATAMSRSATRETETLTQTIADLKQQLETTETSLAEIDLATLKQEADNTAAAHEAAESALSTATKEKTQAETEIESTQKKRNEDIANHTNAQQDLTRIEAEIEALQALLDAADESAKPVSASVSVDKGFEDALAAVLGEGLSAPIGKYRNAFWSDAPPASRLSCPDGTQPLTQHIKVPKALGAALSGVGLVASSDEAEAMQAKLEPGQALTTQKGGLWRWDGFTLPPLAETPAAMRLRQEARLREITDTIKTLTLARDKAADIMAKSTDRLSTAEATIQAQRESENQAMDKLSTARIESARALDAFNSATARSTELTALKTDLSTRLKTTQHEYETLKDTQALHKETERLAGIAEDKRQKLADAMGDANNIRNASEMRIKRQQEIKTEQATWATRETGARAQLDELKARLASATTDAATLADVPEQIGKKRLALADDMEAAQASRVEAGDRLAIAESTLSSLQSDLREAEKKLAELREETIRHESRRDLARQNQADIVNRVGEKLSAKPEELSALAEVNPDEVIDTSDDAITGLERRLENLTRERDSVGPVNLRAEEEVKEIEERKASIEKERDDLLAAIKKLRLAINQINSKGRERLLKSFAEVNKFFGALFNTLFSGGSAEIRLTESEDPLEAGVDILVCPPGKKLQSLSLLSGGEKALTAIALIFAVFMTNPSPICILDEVDAPLDDSNVARFCDILNQIAEKTNTRFIIITHHRLTMARMDRLYGVTMEQKGVSRVVSVDLQAAEKFDKTA